MFHLRIYFQLNSQYFGLVGEGRGETSEGMFVKYACNSTFAGVEGEAGPYAVQLDFVELLEETKMAVGHDGEIVGKARLGMFG